MTPPNMREFNDLVGIFGIRPVRPKQHRLTWNSGRLLLLTRLF
jgi:hypothetical protein